MFFVIEFLTNDHTEGEVRGVGVHVKWFRPIWGAEYGIGAAEIL
jgi:hypothetical protein